MNATVTDAHRQCDVKPNSLGGCLKFNIEREHKATMASILSAITGPGSDDDKLAAVRAIVEPVDPFVLEAERRFADEFRLEGSVTTADGHLAGNYRKETHVRLLAAALREASK